MTPKRTDPCQTCGHPWEWHEPTIVGPFPDDTSCVWSSAFADWCRCPEFIPEPEQ